MTPKDRVQRAVEAIKNGQMVMMVDDEDRENEGDLVYASVFSTPEKVNFMATYAKGLICVALSENIAKRLNLNPMVKDNDSSYETAFTVTVDAKEAATGISAFERDMTIKILASCNSKPSDLVRPGHIFPLIAKEGGVLIRTGHTEGSVDLCRLAGLKESAVICEVLKEDGTMARRPDLDKFCQKYEIPIVYISDIVEHRMQNESLIRLIGKSKTDFQGEVVYRYDFLDHKEIHHIAYFFGQESEKTAVRFHNIGEDHDFLASFKRFNAFSNALKYLKQNGGALIFLGSEESPNRQMREYGIGAQIVKYLGIKEIDLLTTSKAKEFVGISGFGLNIHSYIDLEEQS
ncbi:MAG: bifunctional 3,4-dihydroxy-2-butanone 4-phosphate synthase/GTP cyclohydrolase II [Sulfurospirillaceae bacterium]|jgi:3,4-dihydroxy 2-butanone 4-phosphate synthase/GTP cyclohydrolase II|nr:bifunctional 3,4-dihydroxy-2-butanone 4-phosphate synthase/GTP cyclohydrolase II [Sulfurospirillaceae bacterium]NLM98695.1 bifunctional 3,4-dihydroxy-2-butanone 4-phosphate synthase/GTP cyclohydrolase II [Campylobacteraceae bacterium]